MDPNSIKTLSGIAGAQGKQISMKDLFSVDVFRGSDSGVTITNGIDLAGEGGMVWIKKLAGSHMYVSDTVQGVGNVMELDTDAGSSGNSVYGVTQFNSDGFSTKGDDDKMHIAVTFRQHPRFFQMATYNGNGNSGKEIEHGLEGAPGMVIYKQRSGSNDWFVYHTNMHGQSKKDRWYLKMESSAESGEDQDIYDDKVPSNTKLFVGDNMLKMIWLFLIVFLLWIFYKTWGE